MVQLLMIVFPMLTLSVESGQMDIQRNSILEIPTLLFPQVHIMESAREKSWNNAIWNLGGSLSLLFHSS